jgi:hypothetical protein
MRLRLLAVLVVLLAPAALVPGAAGYRVEGRAWPGGTIPYYNAASDQKWAVAQAVRAWNTSGARVQFVAVPRRDAQLVVRSTGRRSCASARATLGYGGTPSVWIWTAGSATSRCDRYWAAGALAHELGHVLGLGHEDRGCAAMNSSGNRRGPSACDSAEPWEWRCRLLEHDDIRGAVAAYGGRVRAPRADPTCDLYPPIRTPRYIASTIDRELGVLRISIRRPEAPAIPSFLGSRPMQESYVRIWADGPCPATYDARSPRYRWPAAPGETAEIVQRVPASRGDQCLSIWALDGLGRPSARPVSIKIDAAT